MYDVTASSMLFANGMNVGRAMKFYLQELEKYKGSKAIDSQSCHQIVEGTPKN